MVGPTPSTRGNLIGSIVPLLIAAGIAFTVPAARRLGSAAAAVAGGAFVVVLLAIQLSAQMQRPDWRGAAAAIGPPSGPTALVVTKKGDDGLAYYLHAQRTRSASSQMGRGSAGSTPSADLDHLAPKRPFRLVEQRGLAPCCVLRHFRSPPPCRYDQATSPGQLHESQKVWTGSRVIVAGHQSGPQPTER